MFSGLAAFPLTPLRDGHVDEASFVRLVERLVAAGVNAICPLGSTGNYAYLARQERARVMELAVQHAGGVPVIGGIGALSVRDVLALADDAQRAGVQAVLLAPMSYQKLTDDEVFGLYEAVTRELSVPLVVYDNPATTHFEFSDKLHGRIAHLPHVRSIKIPPLSTDPVAARQRVERLRALIPADVTIGISGDAAGVDGLRAGCEAWYSSIGGLFPQTVLAMMGAMRAGEGDKAARLSERLEPIWALFRLYGSLRVVATAAELLGLAASPCLPSPLHALQDADRQRLASALDELQPS